jgi:peptidoglycan/xylan/chitin deacetylase (PgdA/CDA1 family)
MAGKENDNYYAIDSFECGYLTLIYYLVIMPEKILFKKVQQMRKKSTPVFLKLSTTLLIATSLIYLSAAKENNDGNEIKNQIQSHGGIIRGDTSLKKIALVFTGDEFGDGGEYITGVLQKENIHASFFLTGNFYRNKNFASFIKKLQQNNNYLGSHSDKHLLYCDWQKRDSLLVTKKQFTADINNAYAELKNWNIEKNQAHYFLPPYEWYNDSIAAWTNEMKLQLVCFTPGTRSNADYTFPEMGKQYLSSDSIFKSVVQYEKKSASGLNGFILLLHIGTDPRRKDKFYYKLPALIKVLQNRGYQFVKINELLR